MDIIGDVIDDNRICKSNDINIIYSEYNINKDKQITSQYHNKLNKFPTITQASNNNNTFFNTN